MTQIIEKGSECVVVVMAVMVVVVVVVVLEEAEHELPTLRLTTIDKLIDKLIDSN
jgi:hypothetical protein